MDYKRIHKVKAGISPSKLRMKLLGSPHHKNQNESNNNSSRTSSPSRFQDSEFGNNGLLAAENGDFGEEVSSSEVPPIKSDDQVCHTSQNSRNFLQSEELTLGENENVRMQLFSEINGRNSSSIYPVTTYEDETIDSGTTPRFEFDKEKKPLQRSLSRSLSKPMSSKWNDAEKWIVNRHFIQSGISKNINLNDVVNEEQGIVPTECPSFENKPSGRRTFTSGGDLFVDSCVESKDLTDETRSNQRPSGVSSIRSVSMRDMGTEMTPIPSQEPSKSNTPIGAATPLRSPISSITSTPRRDDPAPSPTERSISNATRDVTRNGKMDLAEQEQKLKTRREIVALGAQLGKMNIAAWASKVEKEISGCGNENVDLFELERIAYATRAAAWEEAEKSKHAARFQREETRIQAWENQQKAKLEAEMEKIEAQIVQMRAQAQSRMVKKITRATQKSEEKRAAAEERRNRGAVKTKYQAAHIRRTGQIPSAPAICCGWW
ncbi:uncharacterized protein LOC142540548 isoform X1 [Primulina tabacum]|uniref:uncharacterized protein LOC142540548 isoform X1 n=1 Tax=Primulina tabacum TaxID=48773 RepID=UPI003F59499C